MEQKPSERVYTPIQVAKLFRVDSKTVTRWAQRGLVGSFRTVGGHRRFYADEIDKLIADSHSGAKREGGEGHVGHDGASEQRGPMG